MLILRFSRTIRTQIDARSWLSCERKTWAGSAEIEKNRSLKFKFHVQHVRTWIQNRMVMSNRRDEVGYSCILRSYDATLSKFKTEYEMCYISKHSCTLAGWEVQCNSFGVAFDESWVIIVKCEMFFEIHRSKHRVVSQTTRGNLMWNQGDWKLLFL